MSAAPRSLRHSHALLAAALLVIPTALVATQLPTAADNPLDSAAITTEALYPLRVLVPLGINPFLTLGLLGLGAFYLGMPLPASLAFLAHPVLWIGLLALFGLLWFGRSFKLTKPVVEVVGTTESLIALMAFAAMFSATGLLAALAPGAGGVPGAGTVAGLGGAGPLAANVVGATVLALAAMTGLVVVILVRMGFDLLTWISPFPFVDALLQLAKLVLTVGLIAVALLAPSLAVALNIALLVGAFLAVRWLIRLGRFSFRVLGDRIRGSLRPPPLPATDGSVGPLTGFRIGGEADLPRLVRLDIRWDRRGWWASADDDDPPVALGSTGSCTLDPGPFGTTLSTPGAVVFLTARHRRYLPEISRLTGTPVVDGGVRTPAVAAGRA